ncbi:uncharacterized protein IL334_000213 [Kwoniella shivajii]|uniref:UBA domain-containing protein n=1 Tax=Kwoniella shivajii TaxID=564305 RepID=A0ABZ1CNI4_9TREE|nr:hypothetical protein IL334_000213 [Kwoniella shivajii]
MDDLVDLNWSSPPKSNPVKAPSPTSNVNTPFDFLSISKPLTASGPATPNYYSSTPLRSSTPSHPSVQPNNGPRIFAAHNIKPLSRSATPQQSSSPILSQGAGSGSGLDAFSSLLSMPAKTSTVNNNMSMAERQKALEDEKKRKDEEERKKFEAEGEFWDNLGGTSGVASSSNQPIAPVKNKPQDDFDDFLKPAPVSNRSKSPLRPPSSNRFGSNTPTSGPSKSSSSSGSFWDKHDNSDDLLDAPSSSKRLPQSNINSAPPADPFDFDALSASMTQPQPQPQPKRNGGTGNKHVLDMDEDDILGDLGRPVDARNPVSIEPGPSRVDKQPTRSAIRAMSPPPHIVGQIVEMGFSPGQARQALDQTSTGLDVQAALEILLGGQNSRPDSGARITSQQRNEFVDDDENDEDFVERERQRREEEERERRRRRRQGPSRESVKARSAEDRQQEESAQEQAEKILAQASELGTNMFNKATSFWNSSKEKALKVYEEQRKVMEANAAAAASATATGEGGKPVKDGRPKWMTENLDDEWKDDIGGKEKSGFRDDDDLGHNQARDRPSNNAGPSRRQPVPSSSSSNGRSTNGSSTSAYKSSKEKADLLFADEAPRYISPARHLKKSSPAPTHSPAPVKPLPSRQLVPATNQQLQTSASHKAKGNEYFRLGQFAEAESSYTSAISSLPEGNLHLIPLYNNRAAARLKLGDSAPAAADCTIVIDLIGPTYHPSKEIPLPPEIFKEVKLADGLVKAMTKRAQAWEMGEKWKNAVDDWEKIMGLDMNMLSSGASTTRTLAAEGARRSKKMLEGDDRGVKASDLFTSSSFTAPKPKPRSRPVASNSKPADVDKSAAVSELRAAAKALEVEDEQRLEFKDAIEAKLNTWKNGKETNLRALIASLSSVLWDDILKGGLKVGMHELISEKQVKIKYMKVIARLHPDKLNSQNTTVEQRMLANGAFGTLNEAWQVFNK